MVQVYREQPPLLCQPPSFAQMKKDFSNQNIQVKDTCLKVFSYLDGLRCVVDDFSSVVKDANTSAEGLKDGMDDALSLTSLLKYVVYLPLNMLKKKGEGVEPREENFQNQLQSFGKSLGQIFIDIVLIEVDLRAMVGETPSEAEIEELSKPPLDWPELTQLSVVELLCRVVAATEDEVNSPVEFQATLKKRLTGLKSLGPLEQKGFNRVGLPKTIFACTGNPEVTNGAMVITTSEDYWCGLPSHEAWSHYNRATGRPESSLVQESGGMRNVPAESEKVVQARKDVKRLVPQPDRPKRHLEICTKTKSEFSPIDHSKEEAMPLTCPSFDEKPRCYRCLVLFKYKVPEAVQKLEESPDKLRPYDLWRCAETIAQAYCFRANVPPGSH